MLPPFHVSPLPHSVFRSRAFVPTSLGAPLKSINRRRLHIGRKRRSRETSKTRTMRRVRPLPGSGSTPGPEQPEHLGRRKNGDTPGPGPGDKARVRNDPGIFVSVPRLRLIGETLSADVPDVPDGPAAPPENQGRPHLDRHGPHGSGPAPESSFFPRISVGFPRLAAPVLPGILRFIVVPSPECCAERSDSSIALRHRTEQGSGPDTGPIIAWCLQEPLNLPGKFNQFESHPGDGLSSA